MNLPTPRRLALFVAAMGSMAAYAEDVTLPTIEVSAKKNTPYVMTDENSPATVYQVGGEGVSLFGGPGEVNANKVIDRIPSVNAQSADAYGLANIPGGVKGLRVRGEMIPHGDSSTVEGLPLGGLNPGPGNEWLLDLENVAAVSLRQGPIAPDHFSMFTTNGVLDREILWPKAQRGAQVAQSVGSDNFQRTFARVDSGKLSEGSELFLSASYTEADKWRGPGESPAGRSNVEIAWSRPLGERANGKLLVAYNDFKADNYRPLSYSQASDLNDFRNFDFNPASSATAATAITYYGYNRQDFTNWSFMGEYEYALSDASKLVVKPYYLKENGEYFDGMANGKVRQWLIDHQWSGLTAEVQIHFANTGMKFGYWYETSDPPGPPTAWKMYNPTPGGGLTGASWGILASPTTKHSFNSLYALADQSFGALKAQAGARYVRETLPGINFYNTTGIGDVSYDQALAQSGGVVANRSVSSFAFGEFLPFVAFDYKLSQATDMKVSMGRTYGAPAIDVWPVFQQNSTTFIAHNLTADTLWHKLKAETANALDVGLRINTEQGYFEPTLFYSRNHDKLVSYNSDPGGVNVAYSQNVGETHAYGIQATTGLTLHSNVELFATASYTRNVFDQNLPLLNGSSLVVAGNQLPDTPKLQANLGGSWQHGDFSVTPLMRYTGYRYGDTLQMQKIGGYSTFDLTLNYKEKIRVGKLGASLSVQNIFDRQYIGFINVSNAYTMAPGAQYYPGAPRTVVAKATLDF